MIPRILPVKCYNGIICACGILHILFALNKYQQRRMEKMHHARSPHAGVVIIDRGLHGLLPRKLLPLELELCLDNFQVHLPSLQASRLLPKVVRTATGTLVRRHEPERLLRQNLDIDVVAHAWRGLVVDVVGVVLRSIPRRTSRKAQSEGTLVPTMPERMMLYGASRLMRCSYSSWKDTTAFCIPKGRSGR